VSVRFIKIAANDNVAVALAELAAGTIVDVAGVEVYIREKIAPGHKFATTRIIAQNFIVKYGHTIGKAKVAIAAGEWVHSHNLETCLSVEASDFDYCPPVQQETQVSDRNFMGFERPDGGVGIRNEIWIIPTVGCVSSLAQKLAQSVTVNQFDNLDGCYAVPHQFGCSQLGDDLSQTRRIMAAMACHPNAGGVLIIGLGCENNQLSKLLATIPAQFHYKIKYFEAQKVGDEFDHGKRMLDELATTISRTKRTKISIDKLVIGVKCGGSDGLSGLTANPAIGHASEYFARIGARVIMTEIPEVFGAEEVLLSRCTNQTVYGKLQTLITDFKNYFIRNNQKIYENPSPGNKDGGITTLEEKSLGAVQKGGGAIITGVLDYGDLALEAGLNVLNAPGNDAISSTALVASGAHIILFSTGRGTPLGFMAPTLKISSNTDLAQNKPHWIDFDAGIITKDANIKSVASKLIDNIVDMASGKLAKNETHGIRDFAIWKNGVTL